MPFRYKVVPFRGHAKGGLDATDVARQLEVIIQHYASQGWEFYQLSDVNIEIRPGCIAGLFGATVQYARFDQVIFRASASALLSDVGPNDVTRDMAAGSAPQPKSMQDPATLVAALRDQLRSPDRKVREQSASSLGDLGAHAALALQDLEMLRTDPDLRVRSRAAWAVETIASKLKRQMS